MLPNSFKNHCIALTTTCSAIYALLQWPSIPMLALSMIHVAGIWIWFIWLTSQTDTTTLLALVNSVPSSDLLGHKESVAEGHVFPSYISIQEMSHLYRKYSKNSVAV